jgi:hypothetical protein
MAFSFGYSPWLLVVSCLVAGGLTYWTYRETIPSLSPVLRGVLGTLRFVALALLCFLLLEPVARQIDQIERPPILAVLVDDSESLRVTLGDEDDSEVAPNAVRAAVDQIRAQAEDGEVRLFAFDQETRSLDGSVDSVRLSGSRTNIAAALQSIGQDLQNANLQGVALLSDGRYNTGRNPLYVADRYPVPIHTVTLGDTTRARDLQVRRVTTNDLAYVDTQLPVRVGLRVQDAAGERVTVSLLRDGERLDSQDLSLPSGTAEIPVELTTPPAQAGLQQYTVTVTELDNEATYRNNTRTVTVRVLESKRSVLLMGGGPSPSVASIRRMLARNSDLVVTPRISQQGGGFYEGSMPEDLSTFDVIVLAGYPGPAAQPQHLQQIADAVTSEDLPLLFLLDRRTDLSQLDQTLGPQLPVTLEQNRSGFSQAVFTPADAQRQHPVLQVENAPLDLFDRLPPLAVSDSRWAATPDATILGTATVQNVELEDPMLVVRRRAGTRSAAFLGTGTWRWANLPADLESAQPLWPTLFSNLVRWLAAREADQPVRVRPVESTFGGGERVEFSGQVYDESSTPVNNASVEITVTAPDGTQYPYTMEPVGNGQYELDVGVLPEGTYAYTATASRQGASLGQDQGQFSVGALTMEYRETTADRALMEQIAQRSGGTAHTPSTLDALLQSVTQAASFQPQVVEESAETELWHAWMFLAVILLLLAAEWTLRKRYGLA